MNITMRINTSKKEITDLMKAWIVVSIAFGIVLGGGIKNIVSVNFFFMMLVSVLSVGTGFVLHEMAHKIVAQKNGCFAEFRSFDNMLFLALFMSLFGFVFAAPGAVMINGYITKEKNGKISLAGPLTNLVIGFLSIIIFFISFGIIKNIFYYVSLINIWLGLFNLIPFGNFDGTKILRWNKKIYITAIILGIIGLTLIYL